MKVTYNSITYLPTYIPKSGFVNTGLRPRKLKNLIRIRSGKNLKSPLKKKRKKTKKKEVLKPDFYSVFIKELNLEEGLFTEDQMYKIYNDFKNWNSERRFRKILNSVGVTGYLQNAPIYCRWFPDFMWYEKKIIVEIDGPSHLKPEVQEKDRKKDEFLRSRGWKVFRLVLPFKKSEAKDLALKIKSLLKD